MSNKLKLSWLLFAWLVFVPAPALRAISAESILSGPTLQIVLEDTKVGMPTPVIYINGQFAGVAPGTVQLPTTGDKLAIEIGVPQIKTPLYSFILAPADIEDGKVSVAYSTFFFTKDLPRGDSAKLFVAPSKEATVDVSGSSQAGYKMVLGSATYKQLAQFWATRKLDLGGGRLIDSVPVVSDPNATGDVYHHWKYDDSTDSIEPLHFGEADAWSGAVVLTSALGLPLTEERWIIKSDPAGATVHTDLGQVGSTVVDTTLPMSSAFFIAVELSGYVQGHYKNGATNCNLSRFDHVSELICTLAKAPN